MVGFCCCRGIVKDLWYISLHGGMCATTREKAFAVLQKGARQGVLSCRGTNGFFPWVVVPLLSIVAHPLERYDCLHDFMSNCCILSAGKVGKDSCEFECDLTNVCLLFSTLL